MPLKLDSTYLRLRKDATAEPLVADETFWPRLINGELGTFHDEYLVTLLEHNEDWGSWEKHPAG